MSTAEPLARLTERITEIGPPLVTRTPNGPAEPAIFGELVAEGPRTAGNSSGYAFVVEAIREGYLCHYGSSRILDQPDADLALLAGDLFYAIGIRSLAELDDLESTGILSDLIRVAAELQAGGRADLAEQLWISQIVALACGKSAEQEDALEALRAGETGADERLADWSARAANAHGLGRAFDNAQTAIDSRPSNF